MQEVGGSIPPGSTSLRRLRLLRLGEPLVASLPRRSPKGEDGLSKPYSASSRQLSGAGNAMKYVHILESLDCEHFYVGITDDSRARLAKHNAGEVPHTSKHGPWRIKTYIAFSDEAQAIAFERYLKPASGRAFAKKRL